MSILPLAIKSGPSGFYLAAAWTLMAAFISSLLPVCSLACSVRVRRIIIGGVSLLEANSHQESSDLLLRTWTALPELLSPLSCLPQERR